MKEHLITAWRSGLRSKSFQSLFILGLVAMGGVYLAAQFSGRQPETVALDVGISAIRLIMVLMVVFWCQELLAKEIERKTVFFALAYPVKRSYYLLGKYFGILLLSLISLFILSCLVILTVKFAPGEYTQATKINFGKAFWLTILFIFIDIATISAFTITISAISTTTLLPLAMGIAFAIASRSLGTALTYLQDPQSGAADLVNTLGPIVSFFKWIIPDLSRLDLRNVVLYGQSPSWDIIVWPAFACLIYSAICLLIGISFFKYREFM